MPLSIISPQYNEKNIIFLKCITEVWFTQTHTHWAMVSNLCTPHAYFHTLHWREQNNEQDYFNINNHVNGDTVKPYYLSRFKPSTRYNSYEKSKFTGYVTE